MDRRSFFRKAGTSAIGAVTATSLAAPAIARDHPKISWRLASSFSQSHNRTHGGATDIAERVRVATDGAFDIQVYAEGQIVPAQDAAKAVGAGAIEMAHTVLANCYDMDPTFALGSAIPFGLNVRGMSSWFHAGNGNLLVNAFLAGHNLYSVPAGITGAQMGGLFPREIRTVADLGGVNMNMGGLAGKVLARLGVEAHQIAGDDIYPAMKAGVIDADALGGLCDDARVGFVKLARYFHYPAFWEGGSILHAVVNLETWNGLPRNYQAILQDACAHANTNMLAKHDAKNAAALRQLVSAGAVLMPFGTEILNAAYDAAVATYAELSSENADFKTIQDDQLAFRHDFYLSAQFGEYMFDTFMMMQQRSGKL